ncbi:MAG: gliding motility protein GldC [Ichthyobacteriaceae bacterium]|nr:gliding motility protein GldC [Ichthyobacteriaceae bacterium]
MSDNKSVINLEIELDENKIPEKITWSAKDGGIVDASAKAMLLSVWDEKENETFRIDLWTKEMELDEMKKFFHQTLHSMADTLERATSEQKMADELRDFTKHFGEEIGLLKKEEKEEENENKD